MNIEDISNALITKGLKVTPQRIAILEAVLNSNHPTADQILEYIRPKNPNISQATVYKVLDTLVDIRLIKMVKTDRDIKRYDAVPEKHHHIYYSDSDIIEDLVDPELNELLAKYFANKGIPDFNIEDIILQIVGHSAKKDKK